MAALSVFDKALEPVYHQEREVKYGLVDWLTTVDHKKIGVLYGVAGLFYLLVGGLEALLFRIQIAKPDQNIFVGDTFNGLVTMHATTMVFMAVMPLIAAFSNYFVPLMIGARDVAFPRMNAFSWWTFCFGSILLNSSLIFAEFPAAGWTGYAPLTTKAMSPSAGIDFWWAGLTMLAISSMVAGVNFVVTILNMRAPGMTLMRVPVLVWMMMVIQFLLAFSFPPVAVGLILLSFDRTFGTVFYEYTMGGDPHLWQHLFWVFGHPEVYVLILPSMGIVSEILPVFARRPLFGQHAVIFSGIFIGFVGFGVWGHHMFTAGMGPIADAVFASTTAIIAIPTGVKIFNWLGTLWGAKMTYPTPMIFALSFIPLFTIGGLSGIMHANAPLDLQQHDSYFVVAHFHYVLVGGALMGLFAGFYFYMPKVTGKLMNEALGKVHFWLFAIGLNLTFWPMHDLGNRGMPRRIYTYPADAGWNFDNLLATSGVFLMAAGTLVFVYNILTSLKNGKAAGRDPWDACTLEWLADSPPKAHNFDFTPIVFSERPLWDHKHTADMAIPVPAAAEEIHMPSYSWKPMWVSGGIVLILVGLLLLHTIPFSWLISVAGGLSIIGSLYAWVTEPV
ncbi:MAG: cytochrome c oxidase subunit I [Deltaproteobacteria bacterium]|nr:cytochrome c oxidase subunit I [Deltaproteobacteria bacterium]